MIASIIRRLFGTVSEKIVSSLNNELLKINEYEEKMKLLSDDDIFNYRQKFTFMIQQDRNCTLDTILPEAFAVVREASRRCLSMRHFDVQLIGGIALHKGYIAEMSTGEGKTLVATLPAYLNAISGNGVHIVTVNDYLAKRDSEWMRPVYEFLGLSVGCIYSGCSDEIKKNIYSCDIIYGTNNEFGFDYLRDNMKYSSEQVVQRGLNYAIIDEVDSVLIDEARTPLIISGSADDVGTLCAECNKIVSMMDRKYCEIDESSNVAMLRDEGISFVEQELRKNLRGFKNNQSLYDIESSEILHRINQALKALYCFKKDKDYIVHNGEALIIDEFTGRISEGRRYADGLHQAIEAKEKLHVRRENIVLASITFQSYFKMYKKLSGMTGTAITEMNEFADIYDLKVCQIPTNKPVCRKDYDDEIFLSKEDKYEAIKKLVIECKKKCQPVLIGTSSIENSEILSSVLFKADIKHSVLNAKYHESEAKIIAQAGRLSSVTIATNMAGRGTDIMLGGNPKMLCSPDVSESSEQFKKLESSLLEEKAKVLDAGGLCVIGTERHESRRIDDQLRGRSGRQGDVGSSIFFVSMEDDLMKMFGTERISPFLKKLGMQKGESIKHSWINKSIERAQKKVENRNYEIRKNLFKYDVVLDKQRKLIYSYRKSIMDASKDLLIERTISKSHDICENTILTCCSKDKDLICFDVIENKINNLLGLNIKLKEDLPLQAVIDTVSSEVANLLKDKYYNADQELSFAIQKHIWLSSIDFFWSGHLVSVGSLKESIGLRALGNKDPFNEFSNEVFSMFENGLNLTFESIIAKLFRVEFPCSFNIDEETHTISSQNCKLHKYNIEREKKFSPIIEGSSDHTSSPIRRNDFCHCGSGIKYKKCCGKKTNL